MSETTKYILLKNELDIPAWESEGTVIQAASSINNFEEAYGRLVFIDNEGQLGVVPPIPSNHILTTDKESGGYTSADPKEVIGEALTNNVGLVSLDDSLITDLNVELESASAIYTKLGVLKLIKEFVTEPYEGPTPILVQAEEIAKNQKDLAITSSNSYTDEVLTNERTSLKEYSDNTLSTVKEDLEGQIEEGLSVNQNYTNSVKEELKEEMITNFINFATLFSDITEDDVRTVLGIGE